MAAADSGDGLPPCHVQIFNWVKRFASKSSRLSYKVQKEMALRGLFDLIQTVQSKRCPNSHLAYTERKARQLNNAAGMLHRFALLTEQYNDVILGLQTYFLKRAEYCEAILTGRAVQIAAPQRTEHMNWNSPLHCLPVPAHGRNDSERPLEMGAIPVRSDSAVDPQQSGQSSEKHAHEGDFVPPSFESGWG